MKEGVQSWVEKTARLDLKKKVGVGGFHMENPK
jgi:hypothetical protein